MATPIDGGSHNIQSGPNAFHFHSLSLSLLSPLGEEVFPDHLGMSVNSRVQAHTLNPANHLGNLALVNRTKARARRVRNLSRRRRKLLD